MSPVPIEFLPPFATDEPQVRRFPFIFNVPHASACYPQSFRDQSRLDALTLRRGEDAFVDELFADAARLGAPLMKARFPRAYLDLNREPYELDPKLFKDRLPSYANTRSIHAAGGLGSVPRIVAEGCEIYAHRLDLAEALERIAYLYEPYHHALRQLIAETLRHFGYSILIDCHSMPSTSVAKAGIPETDIVLGDCYGTSCSSDLNYFLETAFLARGYRVVRNKPYAGGFNTRHYGSPANNLHAVQIELNRALYMDEATVTRLPERMERLSADIAVVMHDCMAAFPIPSPLYDIAAE